MARSIDDVARDAAPALAALLAKYADRSFGCERSTSPAPDGAARGDISQEAS